jgi:putative ABC transport system ATP-binding protein
VTDPVLRLEHLSKRFSADRPAIFEGVDLELRRGEYLAIMGESGVGKSTLLNLLAGLDKPDSGRVLLEGIDLGTLDDDAVTLLRRRAVGFVFQAFHVLPYLSVEQNVALPLDLLGTPEPERSRRTREMLAAVGIESLAQRYAKELSGGEVQRVAIARALVHRPRLVLADEPTGNLDGANAAQVFELMLELNRELDTSLVIVTHDERLAARLDRVLTLTDGLLVERGAAPA